MSSQNARRLSTSIATVGSSRNTRSGSPAIAIANRTRCVSPPDSVSTRRPARVTRPARPSTASRASGAGDSAPGKIDELADPCPDRESSGLEHGAYPAGADRHARVEAPGADAARRGVEQPEHQPDCGALAGPVPAEERDRLAGLDREPAIVEREGAAKAAGGAVELDGVDGSEWRCCVSDHGLSIDPRGRWPKSPVSRTRHDTRHLGPGDPVERPGPGAILGFDDRTSSRPHHRDHRPGRVVPRRAPAGEGLRGPRADPPLQLSSTPAGSTTSTATRTRPRRGSSSTTPT